MERQTLGHPGGGHSQTGGRQDPTDVGHVRSTAYVLWRFFGQFFEICPLVNNENWLLMTLLIENDGLLESFRRGSSEALTQVYRHYVKEVAWLVQRGFILKGQHQVNIPGVYNPELEQELVQEIFFRAFSEKGRVSYDGQRPYRPYLLQIAKNVVIDHWRSHDKEVAHTDDDIDNLLLEESIINPLTDGDQESALLWKSQLSATREFLSTLNDMHREFVRLRFEERKSQPELAKTFQVTRWKVRVMEKKVLTRLERYLKKRDLFK